MTEYNFNIHLHIHMLNHVLNISFINMLLHISYLFVLSCFIPYHLSFTFLFLYLSLFTYHHIECYASHIMSCHLHILVIYLLFHACKYLRSGYEKELYIPEDTITLRDNDFYLYDPNGDAIMIQMGSMSSTQTGPRYL